MNKGVIELAKRAGVSKSLVSRKLAAGKTPDQIIAEALESRSRRAARDEAFAAGVASSDQAGEPVAIEKFAEAQRRKETALANLRELELAERRGELVEAVQVETEWVTVCAQIRDAVLSVPEKVAAELAALNDERAVSKILTEALREELGRVSMKLRSDDDSRAA